MQLGRHSFDTENYAACHLMTHICMYMRFHLINNLAYLYDYRYTNQILPENTIAAIEGFDAIDIPRYNPSKIFRVASV
jgi:hypothetical protein